MKKRSHSSGFTLVELLLGILVGAILILTLVALLTGPLLALRRNREYAELRRNVTYAMTVIEHEIRSANYASIPVDPHILTLPVNRVRNEETSFSKSGRRLTQITGGIAQEDLILEGVTVFTNSLIDDLSTGVRGVAVHLEIQSSDATIAVQHEVFIHTRN